MNNSEYNEAIDYLYEHYAAFSKVGASALNPGLENSLILDEWLNHPHKSYHTIHVAGTNGKGSTSHSIASVLQSAGYKVGLYTSPHLIDFRERIRVNGKMISQADVVAFVERTKREMPNIQPSFFEITMMMAFDYFRQQKVDVAVIEVGLGGRLDSTNIIMPDLCVITNIGLEHTQFLGNTLGQIAAEKAGIMKKNIPVVIGERHEETDSVFIEKARSVGAPITFAQDVYSLTEVESYNDMMAVKMRHRTTEGYFEEDSVLFALSGLCQQKNIVTIMTAIRQLKAIGYMINGEQLRCGLRKVLTQTGLMGRWQKISSNPDVIIDTGHNAHGVKLLGSQLKNLHYHKLHIVWGMANDKHPENVMPLLPSDATYYFTRANVERAITEDEMQKTGISCGLSGEKYHTVEQAVCCALQNAQQNDLVFIGGSNFVVAEALPMFLSDK